MPSVSPSFTLRSAFICVHLRQTLCLLPTKRFDVNLCVLSLDRSIPPAGRGFFRVEAAFVPLLQQAGLNDGMSVFDHPDIQVWRDIPERQNCLLDIADHRLHIKRDKPGHASSHLEAAGLKLLQQAQIPTTPLVAHGQLHDGRGFLITEDLDDCEDAEQLVRRGTAFEKLLSPTAALAARLHRVKLHHRDLYLCHFFANVHSDPVDVRLIDAARVRRIPWLFSSRWIVKDLAQFIFSLKSLNIPETQQERWLSEYAQATGQPLSPRRRRAITAKVNWIERHDAKLRRSQPNRNVSIPK